MKIHTKNSVYVVTEITREGRPAFVVEKVAGLPDERDRELVRVGDRFGGHALTARVGEPLRLEDVFLHDHPWRSCGGSETGLRTSNVVRIEP